MIVAQTTISDSVGWPIEVSFQRDDHYLYGAGDRGVYRVALGTMDVDVLWESADDGPGPFFGGGAFFGAGRWRFVVSRIAGGIVRRHLSR